MQVTLVRVGIPPAQRQNWVLDSDAPSLRRVGRGAAVKVSRKAAALVLLLAKRRLASRARSGLGWVDLADVPGAQEWSGTRTSASLASQVRREIKLLHASCPGLIETPKNARLKGPFRLTYEVRLDATASKVVAEEGEALELRDIAATSDALYAWLEGTEPVWRSLYYFDKQGEALSSLPRLNAAIAQDPTAVALASLATAKRMREIGALGKARRTLGTAVSAARREPQWPVRTYLETCCLLANAWLDYRTGDLEATERRLSAVDAITADNGLLSLRGQMLNLRSLVKRSKRQYVTALRDLQHAARLFLIDGDLMHLFAVYHNLACLVAAQAEDCPNETARVAMFRRALTFSERNETYCRRYEIGRNSVLNKLLQSGLHRKLGRGDLALAIATEAERAALDSQNFPDALRAHRQRLSILFESRAIAEAKRVHEAVLNAIEDERLRERFRSGYRDEWARATVRSR